LALRPGNIIANKQVLIKKFLERFAIGLFMLQIRTGCPVPEVHRTHRFLHEVGEYALTPEHLS
jgi:hypothetical protein